MPSRNKLTALILLLAVTGALAQLTLRDAALVARLRPTPAAVSSPSVAGLEWNFDASSNVTATMLDVTDWQSTGVNTDFVLTAANAPQVNAGALNGNTTILFVPGDGPDVLVGENLAMDTYARHVFAVIKTTDTTAYQNPMDGFINDTLRWWSEASGSSWYLYIPSASISQSFTPAVSTANWQIFEVLTDGDGNWMFRSTVTGSTLDIAIVGGSNPALGGIRFGSSGDATMEWGGEIAHVLAYSSVLTNADYSQTINYLLARYGL